MAQYQATIGIECHVQLKTKTKLFAAVGNSARDAEPNTLISHICLGMPGALPVLNDGAVDLAIKAAHALSTEPEEYSNFDRKHYFYPDLPKGYQISQFNYPIIAGGHVDIETEAGHKRIGITRAHMEEDAGKSTHPEGKDYSLVDLNRAGTPLLEIVSEPEISSAEEAKAYARELWLLMRYADVSDADLYHGNMRFDVNVSVSKNPDKLGIRTETKNLNSFKAVEKSVEYEIDRQKKVLESGDEVVQETRGWDDAKQRTFSQRTKEDAHDYRYFPDPDLAPIVLSQERVDRLTDDIKIMPKDIRQKLQNLKIDSSAIETIVESVPAANVLLQCFDESNSNDDVRRVALWLAGETQAYVYKDSVDWTDLNLNAVELIKLSQLTGKSKISSTGAKKVLVELIKKGGEAEQIAAKLDLLQVSDEGEIKAIIEKVIADNPKAAEDVRNGEMKAIGFLVGQTMKASKGKANPGLAQTLIKEQLNK